MPTTSDFFESPSFAEEITSAERSGWLNNALDEYLTGQGEEPAAAPPAAPPEPAELSSRSEWLDHALNEYLGTPGATAESRGTRPRAPASRTEWLDNAVNDYLAQPEARATVVVPGRRPAAEAPPEGVEPKTVNIPGLGEVDVSTPIVGGFAKAISQALSPTTEQYFSAPVRDLPVIGGVSRGIEAGLNVLNEAIRPTTGAVLQVKDIAQAALSQALGMNVPSVDEVLKRNRAAAQEAIDRGDIVGALNKVYEIHSDEEKFIAELLNPANYIAPPLGIEKGLRGVQAAAHVKPLLELSLIERGLLGMPLRGELSSERIAPRLFERTGLLPKTEAAELSGAIQNVTDNFAARLHQVMDVPEGSFDSMMANAKDLLASWKTGVREGVLPLKAGALESRWGTAVGKLVQGFDAEKPLLDAYKARELLRSPEFDAISEELLRSKGASGRVAAVVREELQPEAQTIERLSKSVFGDVLLWAKKGLSGITDEAARAKVMAEAETHLAELAQAKLVSAFTDHAGQTLAELYPKSRFVPAATRVVGGVTEVGAPSFRKAHPNAIENLFGNTLKPLLSNIVLGLNPYYAVRNVWNNVTTMAARGTLGFWGPERIAQTMAEFGVKPGRFTQGFGISGEKGFGMQRVAAWTEGKSSEMAWAIGSSKSMRSLLESGQAVHLSPGFANHLRELDPSGQLERRAVTAIKENWGDYKKLTRVLEDLLGGRPTKIAPFAIDFDALQGALAQRIAQRSGEDAAKMLTRDRLMEIWNDLPPAVREGLQRPESYDRASKQLLKHLDDELARIHKTTAVADRVPATIFPMGRVEARTPEGLVITPNEAQRRAHDLLVRSGMSEADAARLIEEGGALRELGKIRARVMAKDPNKPVLKEIDELLGSQGITAPTAEAAAPPARVARIVNPERTWVKLDTNERMNILMKAGMTAGQAQETALRGVQWLELHPTVRMRALDYIVPSAERAPARAKILITRAEQAQLRDLGYTQAQINSMKPVEAQRILESRVAPTAARESLLNAARALPEDTPVAIQRKMERLGQAGLKTGDAEIEALRAKAAAGYKAMGVTAENPTLAVPKLERAWQARAQTYRDMLDLLGEQVRTWRDLPAAPRVVRGAGGADLSLVRDELYNNIFPALNDAKLASLKMGEWYRDAALLNYSSRYGADAWGSLVFPYEFWPTHSLANWATYFTDNPGRLALYVRLREMLYDKQQEEGFPERFRGTIPVPLPFVPNWLGGGVGFVDPLNAFLPLEQMIAPIKNLAFTRSNDHDVALKIRQMAKNGEVSAEEAEQAIVKKKGALWEMAKQRVHELDQNPYDVASLAASPYPFIDWAWKAMSGRPDEIRNILPIGGLIQSGSAALRELGFSSIPAGGIKIDPIGLIKERLLNAPYDQWENYRVDRALANMVADGRIGIEEMKRARIERTGVAFDEALQRAALEQGVGNVTGLTGFRAKALPSGEKRIYETSAEYHRLIDDLVTKEGKDPSQMEYAAKKQLLKDSGTWKEIVAPWFEKHPEFSANIAKSQEPEALLRSIYVDEVWKNYNALSALDRRDARSGNEDLAKFIDPKTRKNYDDYPLTTLLALDLYLRGYIPKVAKNLLANPPPDIEALSRAGLLKTKPFEPISTEKDRLAYQEFLDHYTPVQPLLDKYEGKVRGTPEEQAQIRAYYQFRNEWRARNPELAKRLEEERKAQTVGTMAGAAAPARGGGGGARAPAVIAPARATVRVPPAGAEWLSLARLLGNDTELRQAIEGYLMRFPADAEVYAQSQPRLSIWLKTVPKEYIDTLRKSYNAWRLSQLRTSPAHYAGSRRAWIPITRYRAAR